MGLGDPGPDFQGVSMGTHYKKPADDAALSFEEIGIALGVSHDTVRKLYRSALKKIQQDGPSLDALIQWASYHHHLRARSAECRAAHEHF